MEKKAFLKKCLDRRILSFTFKICVCIFIFHFTSCSGCSESGRRSRKEIVKRPVVKQSEAINKELDGNDVQDKKNDDLNSLFENAQKAVFIIYTTDGEGVNQGSGFFITDEGIGVSNHHVFKSTIKGSEEIKLFDGEIYKIDQIILENAADDYIVFKIKTDRRVSFLSISNDTPKIGEDVFAIGNPMGLEHTLSRGIISGYRKEGLLLQTTTEITHGSSGGPLLNMKGEVVGITTSGMGQANLNFAININRIRLNKIIKNK